MPKPYTVILGKAVRHISRLRGGGSALPGLFVEKIDPNFVGRTLGQIPGGVVLVSGTNGKTTTTKMIVELLEGQGMKVFTNRTGSNFVRGVAAALLAEVDTRGRLNADIAVLELDEAHAVHFARSVNPKYSLFLNVLRDQLDRFGEIDNTASLLRNVAEFTTSGIVINANDPRLSSPEFTKNVSCEKWSFGASPVLKSQFPSDEQLRGGTTSIEPVESLDHTSLESIKDQLATISFAGKTITTQLAVNGIYNTLNAVAAVALCRMIMGSKLDESAMIESLSKVTPAFGRGESLIVDGDNCELVLVKNPSGFRLGLQSFNPTGHHTMIAINDNYADGRDMSWLWDVDFDSLQNEGVANLTGIRAYDMALRLQYDEVKVASISENIEASLNDFLRSGRGKPKRIFCTYTAMLTIRKMLSKRANVERVL